MSNEPKEPWVEKFEEKWSESFDHDGCKSEREFEELLSFIRAEVERAKQEERKHFIDLGFEELTKAKQEGADEYRQFVLNVLNGIDVADAQMQNNGGGTKAIRFALAARITNTNKD